MLHVLLAANNGEIRDKPKKSSCAIMELTLKCKAERCELLEGSPIPKKLGQRSESLTQIKTG